MIDILFDYRKDSGIKKKTGEYRDPDTYSKRLKEDHCILWSKPLPNSLFGHLFLTTNGKEIVGKTTNSAQFTFNPDSITNCFSKWDKMKTLIDNPSIKCLLDEYNKVDYTIGSSIVFPIQDDNGSSSWTINKARGCSPFIRDRIDYTLECVRLFYLNNDNDSPLKSCLNRYKAFFNLFGDFKSYVKYFLLDDLVTDDYQKVVSFTGTIDFENALPAASNYSQYIKNTIEFIKKRNKRIKAYFENSKDVGGK